MNSILQNEKKCFICRTSEGLEDHHIFPGPNRKHSERYGLKVWLCHRHHTGSDAAVHVDRPTMRWIQQEGQKAFEKTHTREEFLRIFKRSYL